MKSQENKSLQIKIIISNLLSIGLVAVIISSYFLYTLYNHLKEDNIKEAKREIQNFERTLNNTVKEKEKIVRQIGSRTMIRQKLAEYINGKITKEDLIEYSEPKLEDSLSELPDVVSFIRTDREDNSLIKIGEQLNNELIKKVKESSDKIIIEKIDSKCHLLVYSAIYNKESKHIGNDVVLFRLGELKEIINTNEHPMFIFYKKNLLIQNDIASKLNIDNVKNSEDLMNNTKRFLLFKSINTKLWSVFIALEHDKFYKEIKNEIIVSVYITGLLLLMGLVLSGLIIYPLTGKILLNENELNKKILSKTNQLQTEIKVRDTIYRVLAHDLRSPVSSNISMLDLVIEQLSKVESQSSKDIQENLHLLQNSNTKLLNLIENILSWAELKDAKRERKKSKISLQNLIENNIQLVEQSLKEKNIEVEVECEKNVILYANPNMMDIVIRNLLGNAIKFSEKNSKINIRAFKTKEKVTVEVKDRGIGMSKKQVNNIFDYQEKATSIGTAGEKGTGLGLSICKEFVESNNGKIEIESEEGKGTSIQIVFEGDGHGKYS